VCRVKYKSFEKKVGNRNTSVAFLSYIGHPDFKFNILDISGCKMKMLARNTFPIKKNFFQNPREGGRHLESKGEGWEANAPFHLSLNETLLV